MSEMENLDVMQGNYSRNETDSQISGNVEEIDQKSSERQTNTNPIGEGFRTLLNRNSIGNIEITSEAARIIKSEVTSQVSSRVIELKFDLNLRIRETIEQCIPEQLLPTIRQTLGEINNGDQFVMNRTSSSGILRSNPVRNTAKKTRS